MSADQCDDVFRWSTLAVPRSQRVDYFAGEIGDRLVRIALSSDEGPRFSAELECAPLGPLTTARFSFEACTADRSAHCIAQSTDASHAYQLVVAFERDWELTINGSRIHLAPGDLVLIDNRVEHTYHWSSNSNINLRLPIEWLDTWIPDAWRIVGKKISFQSQWGAALSSYVRSLTPRPAGELQLPGPLMADHVGTILAIVSTEHLGICPAAMSRYRILHEQIVDCIHQRSTEPALTPADVAASMHLSVRTLHRVLGAFGACFGTLLVQIRLDTASRMLRSRIFDRVSVSEISRRAGFLDASYFARSFRGRFGIQPSQLRSNPDRSSEDTRTAVDTPPSVALLPRRH